jgi:hypothetical protein
MHGVEYGVVHNSHITDTQVRSTLLRGEEMKGACSLPLRSPSAAAVAKRFQPRRVASELIHQDPPNPLGKREISIQFMHVLCCLLCTRTGVTVAQPWPG